MSRFSWRHLLGGALTATMFAGCSSRSPLSTEFHVAPASTVPPAESGEYAAQVDASSPDAPRRAVLDEDATLDDYLHFAALENPGLAAKFHEWQAALEKLPQARTLPDPRLTYGYYLGEVETRVGPMQHTVSISQMLPWLGTLTDRESLAARNAEAAYQRLEAARLALFFEVEYAFNELAFLHESIEITETSIELLQQFEQVAQIRYRVAATSHPDLVKIQVELGTTEDRLHRLNDLRAPYAARLNAALNRPIDTPIPRPTMISERVNTLDLASLAAALRRQSPALLAIREEIERDRIATSLARREAYPDLTVGLAYTAIDQRIDMDLPENGDDAVLATFSINVPIWREKYDAAVRESISRRLASSGRHADLLNEAMYALQDALFQHNDAQRRIALYRDTLIPKATESLESSLAAFEQDRSDFFDLIDTQRTLLEFQLAFERARIDRASSYARLEKLVGTPLTDIDPIATEDES